ncbi:MAG: FAD-dependent oxidoreductase [Pseudonocardiaceae bacterium]|nr:FAD-dependent oxidoreductase [Pseudonocardiaceae bacterium]
MTAGIETASRETAKPASVSSFDALADVVVVGGGGGGLPTALFSSWLGNDVILLEKAPELGGTAKKAAFWYWVPNNVNMRAQGIEDRKEDYLRYVARLSRPTRFDPDSPTYGLTDWEFSMCTAIYESASDAVELLNDKGALPYRHCPDVPDYWAEVAEDKAPRGRVLCPRDASESMANGGEVAIATMSAAAEREENIDIRTRHRVQRLIVEADAVVGVEASIPDGTVHRIGARKGVIFASGGFTHNAELRQNSLHTPAYPGCAAATNEGDFVRIATGVGAQLRNMNYAWMCPVPLEKSGRADLVGMFSVAGDSMMFVDKHGHRVANEKQPYNELAQTFFRWDPIGCEYPNLVLVQIWDQRSQDHSASTEYGRLIAPEGADDSHVITGETVDELADAVADRLTRTAKLTGGFQLAEDFLPNLRETIKRFNEFAERGVDEDFHRGEKAIEPLFNGLVKDEPDRRNPTMWPISDSGPYYAALVTGGTLDTKGGPKTTPDGEVVDDMDLPVPGLYGLGNCVASASAGAYWAGGATLGPIMAFAYRTAKAAHAAPAKSL